MSSVRRAISQLVLFSFLMVVGTTATAANDLEAQIKAAYLYKFTAYIDWPTNTFAQANAALVVGVINADDIAEALIQLRDSGPAQNRKLEVRLLKVGDALTGIHILLVSHQDLEKTKRLFDSIQSHSILTVTDTAGALAAGSTINFITVDDHIRFEISMTQAERRSLKISARLLTVAQKVESLKP